MLNRRRLVTGLVGALALVVAAGGHSDPARAQCDIPLISQQVATPPNVMIVLDNSGSMNEVMYHEAYDARVAWPGLFEADRLYSVSANGTYSPASFRSTWPNLPTAKLVAGRHGQAGRYRGNYLNWVYFHATPLQRDAIPTVTRQMVANTAVKYVMNQASGLRYGITQFNFDQGGKVVANCGSSTSTLESIVDGMVANTWTPTAETLVDVVKYFQTTGGGAPIQYECQKNFVVLVTDGIPTMDLDVPSWIGDQDNDGREPGDCASIGFAGQGTDCSDYLDDVAYYLAHNDMRPDLNGKQEVSVYTIGFGIRAQLLVDAAENGNGLYREAWDLQSLVVELGTVIGDIVNRISAGAAVAVVSTETGTDNRLYRGKFMPGLWRGYLESYRLPYSPGASPEWEAGRLLQSRNPNDRRIFTSLGDQTVEFTPSEVDRLRYFIAPNGPGSGTGSGFGADADDDFDLADQTLGPAYSESYVKDVISYVRGEDRPGYRRRDGWKLGDLVYSTPVVVGPPSQFFFEQSYQDFLADYASRPPTVYVGANDGMLHAFDAQNGKELWGYVPQTVLGKLEKLLAPDYCRQSYVDLSPSAHDVKIGGLWRTVLFGGLRRGGYSYFALDVTSSNSPKLLWETYVPTLASAFTDPVVVRTNYGAFLWTGSGPNPGGTAYSSVIGAENGYIYWNLMLSNVGSTNAATAPAAIDLDWDGLADRVYQGDLAGNLWAYDISGGAWYYRPLFVGDRPIQARPALALDENGNVMVFFGSGKYIEGSDLSTSDQEYFYAIRDDGSGYMLREGDLLDVSSGSGDPSGHDGWYFALENRAGERVTEPAVVVEGVVYCTSFAPSDKPCSAGGRSYLYAVDYLDGRAIDRDEDGETNDESRSEDLGDGVASRPVVNLAGEELIVQTSDARLNVQDLLVAPRRLLVRAWRERFDAMNATAVETAPQN